MRSEPDGLDPTFEKLKTRGDAVMVISRDLIAQLKVLLKEHEQLQDHFIESHRRSAVREDDLDG